MNILCKYCNNLKLETNFTPSQLKIKSPKCKECIKEYIKQYCIENKEDIKAHKKEYYIENKEERKEYEKQYRTEHKEEIKEYSKQYNVENKEYINEYRKQYQKNRMGTDPVFKLRNNVSSSIYMALRSNGSSKNGLSILKYLSYTIEELKNYLESLFEPWMDWRNWTTYDPELWDNNDQSTWVWHLDHIIPQTYLPYTNMEEYNFKICWELENLRPYNAKKNIEEKNNRSQEEIAKIKSDIKEHLDNLRKINNK